MMAAATLSASCMLSSPRMTTGPSALSPCRLTMTLLSAPKRATSTPRMTGMPPTSSHASCRASASSTSGNGMRMSSELAVKSQSIS